MKSEIDFMPPEHKRKVGKFSRQGAKTAKRKMVWFFYLCALASLREKTYYFK
jgi:hypothetical protein